MNTFLKNVSCRKYSILFSRHHCIPLSMLAPPLLDCHYLFGLNDKKRLTFLKLLIINPLDKNDPPDKNKLIFPNLLDPLSGMFLNYHVSGLDAKKLLMKSHLELLNI